MKKGSRTAISPTRSEDFPGWYQSVIRGAEMAESSAVRGCMIIRPWGYAIWEAIKSDLDRRIKETGHENCYFPLFIPLSYIEREADHVSGFAKEMAVVTHHRVEQDEDGKLVPAAPLTEPLIVRPTSETMFGEALAKWVSSYRDLPVLLNQWANVVRWEMRPRIFLRTSEFLWQEGHTVHATQEEAEKETVKMINVYRDFMLRTLAIPSYLGVKSPQERFPGAVETYSIEAVMQDGKALQAGTSHYLGQNFSKASDIKFQDEKGDWQFGYTTSWGASSRLIGALIMTHADDNGLRLPSAISPHHIVFIPIARKNDIENENAVLEHIERVVAGVKAAQESSELRLHVDRRYLSPQKKRWEWIKKGVCLICEIGNRDIDNEEITYTFRHSSELEKSTVPEKQFIEEVAYLIESGDSILRKEAIDLVERKINSELVDWEGVVSYYQKVDDSFDNLPGLSKVWCCLTDEAEDKLATIGLAIRNVPLDQEKGSGKCVATGGDAEYKVIIGQSY